MYELIVEASFSAAHNLRGYEGACENLHGHNWRVEAAVASDKLDGFGMALDFRKLKAALKGILDGLDHKYINEVPPFDKENPTAENISRFIYVELSKTAKGLGVKVARVRVWESDNASAVYRE
ncbi:MAG: 6-carboxytetrahydropterin synthase QueD [Deltaproteobacteria bacterium]|nr:6-carboxytetrahydropterin synthase QueD [Deltaproteobacteria bacterium]